MDREIGECAVRDCDNQGRIGASTPVKITFPEEAVFYVLGFAAVAVGAALVVAPAILTDFWKVTLAGLVAGTVFFAIASALPGILDHWPASDTLSLLLPFAVTGVFVGILGSSGMAMIANALILRFNLGETCVVSLIALMPIGLMRENRRLIAEGGPPRLWRIAGWLTVCAVFDTFMWFRPDLLRLPIT